MRAFEHDTWRAQPIIRVPGSAGSWGHRVGGMHALLISCLFRLWPEVLIQHLRDIPWACGGEGGEG